MNEAEEENASALFFSGKITVDEPFRQLKLAEFMDLESREAETDQGEPAAKKMQQATASSAEKDPEQLHNFRITDNDLGAGGPKQKFRANMDAVYLLKKLEEEGRLAVPEEQEILSRFVGWGYFAGV